MTDVQSPEVGEVQPPSARWQDSCKPETLCDTTSDHVESVTSPMTSVKVEYDDVIGSAVSCRGGVRRLGKMAATTNSTSAGRRRNSGGGSVRIEERRFRCAECFKAFKFKHHLQVSIFLPLSRFTISSKVQCGSVV